MHVWGLTTKYYKQKLNIEFRIELFKLGLELQEHSMNLCIIIPRYMEVNPSWKSTCHSATQEIPNMIWNPEVHHHVHESPKEFLQVQGPV
jgi:hypothetical protein